MGICNLRKKSFSAGVPRMGLVYPEPSGGWSIEQTNPWELEMV